MTGLTISQPDITLQLDLDGTIRGVTFADGVPAIDLDAWVGRSWSDTVGGGGSASVHQMLQVARTSGVSAYRMVNQRFPDGLELPVEYSTIRLGGDAGLIAIGRHLHVVTDLQNRLVAAHQAREQDYWKLREVETRYRMLFDTSSEVVLVVSADGLRVIEANLAALRTLGLTPGQDFMPALPRLEHAAVRAMLERVRGQGRAPGVVVHMGMDRAAWTMRASMMSSEPGSVFLLQLAPMSAIAPVAVGPTSAWEEGSKLPIDELVERLPDAFVVVDQDGGVLHTNPAFLGLIHAGKTAQVLGENLGRWLSRPGADMLVLLACVRRDQYVRLFATSLQRELETEIDVEISASGDVELDPRFISLIIRDVSSRTASGHLVRGVSPTHLGNGQALLGALGVVADGLGQTSLPTLVKEAVGLIERHYISAALECADGNRTATAELLGLSRQSLYMKLNRYGLDNEPLADLAQ